MTGEVHLVQPQGQAATAAPTGPSDQPWVTFAARVAMMPSASSQRARAGRRAGAAYKTTIEEEYNRPSMVAGSSRAVISFQVPSTLEFLNRLDGAHTAYTLTPAGLVIAVVGALGLAS